MSIRIERASLGQEVCLGTLYDARYDRFVLSNLCRQPLVGGDLAESPSPLRNVKLILGDSLEDRLSLMEMSKSLQASYFAGMVNPLGASSYLSEAFSPPGSFSAAVLVQHTTCTTRVDLMKQAFCIDHLALNSLNATHVVVAITWGLQSIISITTDSGKEQSSSISALTDLTDDLRLLEATLQGDSTEAGHNTTFNCKNRYRINVFCDVLQPGGIMVHSMQEVLEHCALLPLHITHELGSRGFPLSYTLLSLETAAAMLGIHQSVPVSLSSVPSRTLDVLLDLLSNFHEVSRDLHNYYDYVYRHRHYLGHQLSYDVASVVHDFIECYDTFLNHYSSRLEAARTASADPHDLLDLHSHFFSHLQPFSDFVRRKEVYVSKVTFLEGLSVDGVTYAGFNGKILEHLKIQNGYVLVFNSRSNSDQQAWIKNQAVFRDLLGEERAESGLEFAVFDGEEAGLKVDIPYILHYQEGVEISHDVVADISFHQTHCLAHPSDEKEVEKFEELPIKRYPVKIPCLTCKDQKAQPWLCSTCRSPLEFGIIDEHIYCECGRTPFSNLRWKCCADRHGKPFRKFKRKALRVALQGLSGADNLNILILGETGVGKSTFINAFVNYLTYDTLDEAKSAEKMVSIIPCSFTVQAMDRSRPDQPIQETKISIGQRKDEQDGSTGESATQMTSVYPITVGDRVIRLIDTPGACDTRGLQQEKKNMADILTTLSNYDDLHGILLLVKSNSARLTATFNFCVKELLIHLHRSAAANMAFAFTNTRISNYTPGDTFGPLKALLEEHNDEELCLTVPKTYCFDSESFRFLAAYKNGHEMDNEDDFRRSWKHSRDEAHRLIDYFKTKPPHQIKKTVSLHGARQAISDLIKPLADISGIIRTNIELFEDRKQALSNTQCARTLLIHQLNVEKRHLRAITLPQPRTVCTDADCVEFEDDGTGVKVTIYKSHCHAACYLHNIATDAVAYPGLINCAAFAGSDHCQACGHQWQSHMHVLYELEAYMEWVKDPEIQRQLAQNADERTLRRTAVAIAERTIEEYRTEHKIVQKAAAQFGVFLREHAIATHNDATLAYLDLLIRNEEGKVTYGGSRKRLDDLQDDRARYVELTDMLLSIIEGNYAQDVLSDEALEDAVLLNEADVAALEQELFALPHFGKDIRDVKEGIVAAHATTNRERPYRVQPVQKRPPQSDNPMNMMAVSQSFYDLQNDSEFPPLPPCTTLSMQPPRHMIHGSRHVAIKKPKGQMGLFDRFTEKVTEMVFRKHQ